MFTIDVFMEGLFVTTAANLGINECLAINDRLMILTMACAAANGCRMNAALPLRYRSRRLLFVALNAIFSKNRTGHAKGQANQAEQTKKTTHWSISSRSFRYSAGVISSS
jgi:hypothetical protein